MPFAVILGDDEQAQGKVKIKELGLPDGHPQKDGVLVLIKDLVQEVNARLKEWAEKNRLQEVTTAVEGLDVAAGPSEVKDVKEVKTAEVGV